MRAAKPRDGSPVEWRRAFLLTAKWFFMATVSEAVLMLVFFGGHALCRIYLAGERGPLPLLVYGIVGAWITVGGHVVSLIAASIIHRSWKIAFLYIGLPILLAVLIWAHFAANLGSMMA